MQHWVNAEQNGLSATLVPVDAPMVTLGDIARGVWPQKFGQRRGTIFSYIMSNYAPEGYPAGQGGSFTFRYIFSTESRFSAVANGRLGWAAMSPFEIDEIKPNDKSVFSPRPLPASQNSFLNIDQPDVTFVTWKLAEDGNGTIVRLLETAGQETKARVEVPLFEITSAWRCNAVEDNQQKLEFTRHAVSVSIKPFQIVTIRLQSNNSLSRR